MLPQVRGLVKASGVFGRVKALSDDLSLAQVVQGAALPVDATAGDQVVVGPATDGGRSAAGGDGNGLGVSEGHASMVPQGWDHNYRHAPISRPRCSHRSPGQDSPHSGHQINPPYCTSPGLPSSRRNRSPPMSLSNDGSS
jgi:hypothetical protein